MSELKIIGCCRYLTTGTGARPEDFDAIKMVKALKGDSEIRGSFRSTYDGRTYFKTTASSFVSTVPGIMWTGLAPYIEQQVTLVPVPNSHVTAPDDAGFTTLDLAKKIASLSNGIAVAVPGIVFGQPQQKSRHGGSRNPYHLKGEMRIATPVSGRVVLIDDVLTTGAHMKAATWLLKEQDAEVVLGGVFAFTTHENDQPAVRYCEQYIDVSQPFDF